MRRWGRWMDTGIRKESQKMQRQGEKRTFDRWKKKQQMMERLPTTQKTHLEERILLRFLFLLLLDHDR